jgi:hypothetical protein
MKTELLQQLVLRLLESGIYKTTAQVVEEFRMEYPMQWRQLEKEGEMLYGKSCSSLQQPSTRISQALLSLPAKQCLRRSKLNQYYWSR